MFLKKKRGKIPLIFHAEDDFENQNFAIFEEVLDNFGRYM